MSNNYLSSESSDESASESSFVNSPRAQTPKNDGLLEIGGFSNDNNFGGIRPYSKDDLKSVFVLPPEILTMIFSSLDKAELVSLLPVCKFWARLLVEQVWFRPKIQSKRAYNLIGNVLDLDPNETFVNYREHIRRLNVCFLASSVEDSFLAKFENCPNLERLTLVNCSNLSSSTISKVLKNCSKLQSIDMSGLKVISDEIFDALAENCPRLQGVYAPDAGRVSNRSLLNLFRSCPYLKRIKLTKSENVNDEAVQELAKNFKYVVEIDLHGCPNVTDESLTTVFENLEQLREFRISQNRNITDKIFASLPDIQFLNRLRILDFTDCSLITDRAIAKIVICAPRLRNVVLSKCLNITDASLRSLATLTKSLHYIHLGHCSNITDYGVKLLIKSCYRLQYIDLACCTQLTNASVVELASLNRLKRIGLVKCTNITDQGITQLVQERGPADTLERVHLSYCTQLTGGPIYLLLRYCPKLTHLSLTGINSFLRPEFKRYCRAPPDDFTAHQKSLFCVFSGSGVKKLKEELGKIFDNGANNLPNTNAESARQLQIQQRLLNQQQQLHLAALNNPEQLAAEFNNFNPNVVPTGRVATHTYIPIQQLQQLQQLQRIHQTQRAVEMNNPEQNVQFMNNIRALNNLENNINNIDNNAPSIQRFGGFQWNNAFVQTPPPHPETLLFPSFQQPENDGAVPAPLGANDNLNSGLSFTNNNDDNNNNNNNNNNNQDDIINNFNHNNNNNSVTNLDSGVTSISIGSSLPTGNQGSDGMVSGNSGLNVPSPSDAHMTDNNDD